MGETMRYPWIAGLIGLITFASAVRAEHAAITLRVIRIDPETRAEKDEISTTIVHQEPPGENVEQRPQFKAKAGEPLVLQFILTNTYPHGEKKDVRIRYFVVRESKAKQKAVPDLREGVVTQGRFTLNYKPKCRVGARQSFTIKEPGVYLLRVQTENTDSDHEHFSAIDIVVEK
jgi:hypothetical protein